MVKPFRPPIRASIGRQRIPQSDQAGFERAVRAQLADVLKNFEAWAKYLGDVSPEILKEAFQPTFDKSQEYVPKDTLALMESGYLVTRKFRGRTVMEIGYGKGGQPPYAAKVHEDLEAFHADPTRAKFLEDALLEDEKDIQDRIFTLYREASGV